MKFLIFKTVRSFLFLPLSSLFLLIRGAVTYVSPTDTEWDGSKPCHRTFHFPATVSMEPRRHLSAAKLKSRHSPPESAAVGLTLTIFE